MIKEILAIELLEHIYQVYGIDEAIAVLQDLQYSNYDIYEIFMTEFSIEIADLLEEQL
jgi:hypothetical protein